MKYPASCIVFFDKLYVSKFYFDKKNNKNVGRLWDGVVVILLLASARDFFIDYFIINTVAIFGL